MEEKVNQLSRQTWEMKKVLLLKVNNQIAPMHSRCTGPLPGISCVVGLVPCSMFLDIPSEPSHSLRHERKTSSSTCADVSFRLVIITALRQKQKHVGTELPITKRPD